MHAPGSADGLTVPSQKCRLSPKGPAALSERQTTRLATQLPAPSSGQLGNSGQLDGWSMSRPSSRKPAGLVIDKRAGSDANAKRAANAWS